MSTIIRANFGGRPRAIQTGVQDDSDDAEAQEQQADLALADFRYYLANADRVREALAQCDAITEYVFGLANFQKKEESLDLRQGTLANTPVEVLCTQLLESTELQWGRQPHFYGAAILELNERCQVISALKQHLASKEHRSSRPSE